LVIPRFIRGIRSRESIHFYPSFINKLGFHEFL
jgi:hypothetical protein